MDPYQIIKKLRQDLNRWEIDLTSNSGSIKKDYLDEHIGEFPRLDERFSMSNYRYGIYASNHGDSPKGISFNSVTRYDYETGNKEFFYIINFSRRKINKFQINKKFFFNFFFMIMISICWLFNRLILYDST